MKKVLGFLCMACVFIATGAVAGELGNPAQFIKQGQLDVGFQWKSVFKQGFEDYDLNRTYSDGTRDAGRKGADFESDQYYMATVTYGILDRLNVFGWTGSPIKGLVK